MPHVLVISNYGDSLNAVRPEGRLYVGLMRDFGWRVSFLTQAKGAYVEVLRAAGAEIIDGELTKKLDRAGRRQIVQILQRPGQAIDVLHLYNNKAIVNGIAAAKQIKWPGLLLTYRGYTGNVNWWDPTAYWMHLNPRVDAITCVSPAVKEVFDRLGKSYAQKAHVVGKGHDPAWYADIKAADLQEDLGIPANRKVVIIIANARRMKGMNYLDAAIKALPPNLGLHFLYVGRGLDTPATKEAFADSHYARQFSFAGFRTDVLSLIKAADISLLPSVKGEGLSKVLLESMFLGKATIMTDIGGNRNLGIDGETCLIIPPKDPAAIVDALQRLAEEGPLCQRLGEGAKAYMNEHYHADRTAAELNELYCSLLKA
ncbi:MAG: glycosyltransferase family 4 protein [Bacteroidota bacterium]